MRITVAPREPIESTRPVQALAPSPAPRRRLAVVVGLGWGVRNYLLTDAFDVLKQHFDLVILSDFCEFESFRLMFEGEGVATAVIKDEPEPRSARLIGEMTATTYYYWAGTASHLRKIQTSIERNGKRWINSGFVQRWSGRLYPLLRLAYRRELVRKWKHHARMRGILRENRVDAVFSTNQMNLTEWGAVLAARQLGLPVVSAITSWDNPSTKRFPLCKYDGVLAWSPRMKEQVKSYLRACDEAAIHVTGPPQFDYYRDPRFQLTREEFCRPLGLDPARKILVYSTVTPGIMPDEPIMIRQVHDWILSGAIPGNPQMLIRLHPKDRIDRYADLRTDPRRRSIAWTLAGTPKIQKKDQWCPDHEDMVRAVNTVRHGDVNVHCRYSTMMLDFASEDKPVVVIAYDSQGDTAGALAYEDYEHLRLVLRSGGVRVAYREDEALAFLKRAFEEPQADRDARRAMVEAELGTLDGKAGVRAGNAVVECVERAFALKSRWARKCSLVAEIVVSYAILAALKLSLRLTRKLS